MATNLASIKQDAAVAKAKPTTIHGFLETYKDEIRRALPRHMTADRMARIALTEFRKTPALMKCDPATLFGAVIQCAQLGLEPGGALGHCYLLPFENRKKGTTDVQFLIGYKGMLDIARRSGQIISISARTVHERDQFTYRFGLDETIEHVPADGERGELTHVYAVAKLRDGGVQFEVMSRHEIEKIRNASQGYKTAVKYDRQDSPWIGAFEEMAKKTVIRRLFKYLPVSIEMAQAIALDERADAGLSQGSESIIEGIATPAENTDVFTFAEVAEAIAAAKDSDMLAIAADLIGSVASAEERDELGRRYKARAAEIGQ